MIIVIEKSMGRGRWVQNGSLRTSNPFFDFVFVVDNRAKLVVARLPQGLAFGISDKTEGDYAFPPLFGRGESAFRRTSAHHSIDQYLPFEGQEKELVFTVYKCPLHEAE